MESCELQIGGEINPLYEEKIHSNPFAVALPPLGSTFSHRPTCKASLQTQVQVVSLSCGHESLRLFTRIIFYCKLPLISLINY